MDFYTWMIVVFIVFTAVIALLVSRGDPDEEALSNSTTIEELRARQISGLREHAITQKFEASLNERTDSAKRQEIELMLKRAGLDKMSYLELFITKIAIALFSITITWLFLNSPVISLAVGIATYMLPTSIISMIANRRTNLMDKDIGTFIQLVTERYKVHGDFQKGVKQSAPDFIGHEPLYSELQKTILEFNVGISTYEAIENLGARTGNKFITQLASYYEIASTIGTESSRDKIIGQAWVNFNDDYNMRQRHKQEIDGPKKDAYIILAALPLFMVYQAMTTENYISFWLDTMLGQFGLGAILIVIVLSLIFINKKIGGPLE